MHRMLIYVEGQTEETFVREVLARHLYDFGAWLIPTLAVTKRVIGGPNYKGGILSYEQVRRDINRLLADTNAVIVTTMMDYYALPGDFPGVNDKKFIDPFKSVEYIEHRFRDSINKKNFLPYLALHEFEAMLFASPNHIANVMSSINGLRELEEIKERFRYPELINNHPQTAPSKRLIKLFPGYQKPLHGNLIALEIGLVEIRRACPHFDAWISALEALAQRL